MRAATIVLLVAASNAIAGLAPASEPVQAVAHPWREGTEAVLPVAPYAGGATPDPGATRWSVDAG